MQRNTTSCLNPAVKSAGDMLHQMGVPDKPVDYITGKVLCKKLLSGASRYSYCPYCYQRVKRAGLDYRQELKPLISVTYKNLYKVDGSGLAKIIFENELVCSVCRDNSNRPKRITLEDFSKIYAAPYKPYSSLFVDVNDPAALKQAGFEEFAESMVI